jgi:hypothetical protein
MERKTQYGPFSRVNPKLEDWINNFGRTQSAIADQLLLLKFAQNTI